MRLRQRIDTHVDAYKIHDVGQFFVDHVLAEMAHVKVDEIFPLAAASRAIDTCLAETPLADRLSASGVPAELFFGEHDARAARPPSHALTHTLLAGVGRTPPWEAADRIAIVWRVAVRGGLTEIEVELRTTGIFRFAPDGRCCRLDSFNEDDAAEAAFVGE